MGGEHPPYDRTVAHVPGLSGTDLLQPDLSICGMGWVSTAWDVDLRHELRGTAEGRPEPVGVTSLHGAP